MVEDSLTGFLTAFKTCLKHGIHLKFGLRIQICNNYESVDTSKSKVILFALNDKGFKDLNKIFTFANTEKDGVISNDDLTARLTDDILVCFPFYDSYIWNNYHYFNNCLLYNIGPMVPLLCVKNLPAADASITLLPIGEISPIGSHKLLYCFIYQ